MRGDPQATATTILRERYPAAAVALLAGSVVRGEATATSDLDVVVLHDHLPHAYRESFHAGGWPVETFVFDLESLRYFLEDVDRPSGVPSLARMLVEGIELPAPHPLSTRGKNLARDVLDAGPPPLADEPLRRYAITDLLDDLRAPRDAATRRATAARLYERLADYTLRARGVWSAHGKTIPAELRRHDPILAERFVAAFDAVFAGDDPTTLVALTEDLLAPHGGLLFDGFRLDAPPGWRKPA